MLDVLMNASADWVNKNYIINFIFKLILFNILIFQDERRIKDSDIKWLNEGVYSLFINLSKKIQILLAPNSKQICLNSQ